MKELIIAVALSCLFFILFCIILHRSNKRNREHEERINDIQKSNREIVQSLSEKNDTLLEENKRFSQTIHSLNQEMKQLRDENNEINKRLNFYLNIDEESSKLVIRDDPVTRDTLVEQAVQQILTSTDDLPIQENSIKDFQSPASHEDTAVQHSALTVSPPVELLDKEQSFAREYLERTNNNVFVSGKAGTGKSFLLDVFIKTTKKKCIILAPTGIAALNIHGTTIHSAFGYYNLVNLDVDDINPISFRLKSEKLLVLKEVETIIIDEISMVRADTFEKINRILKVISSSPLPFGGKQLIVFGDLFQLPPITKTKEEYHYLINRYGGIYFFNSEAFKSGSFKYIELSINHRQVSDQLFFEILNRIRNGQITKQDIDLLNSKIQSKESAYDRFIALLPTKAAAERINAKRLAQLPSPEYEYTAKINYNKYSDQTPNLEAIFPFSTKLKLRKGALIMMVANDINHRWVNGTLGIVKSLTSKEIFVSINGQVHEIHKKLFTQQEVIYRNGKIIYEDVLEVEQFPLVLAYAITIHKSQGQTYRNIICDISKCFTCGQAYVALSRCATLDGLHLKSPVIESSIQVDQQIRDFYKTQKNLLSS